MRNIFFPGGEDFHSIVLLIQTWNQDLYNKESLKKTDNETKWIIEQFLSEIDETQRLSEFLTWKRG